MTEVTPNSIWLPRNGDKAFAEVLSIEGDQVRYRMFFGGEPLSHTFIHDRWTFVTRFQPKEHNK